MDILIPAINAVVVAAAVLVVNYVGKERTDPLERRMDQRFEDLSRQFEQMFGLMRDEFRQVRVELATMRSDITNIALQVGARPQPNAG